MCWDRCNEVTSLVIEVNSSRDCRVQFENGAIGTDKCHEVEDV